MSDAPTPIVFAALESFAYELRPAGPEPVPPIDVAEQFHEASKIAAGFPGQSLGPAGRLLLASDDAPFALGRKALTAGGPRIPLPPAPEVPVDLRALAYSRRSELPPDAGAVALADLGTLLGLSAGAAPGRPGFRVTPSAGALYPLDVFVIAFAVEGLPRGGYVYDPIGHGLLPRGALDPDSFHTAAATGNAPPAPSLIMAVIATFARTRAKYGPRGYRFALMEAGHVAQAVLTVGTALGLATLPLGGFADAEVDAQLDLDGIDRSCLYLLALSARPPGEAP
jgi:SagB-type dehydrogenase family enzyme